MSATRGIGTKAGRRPLMVGLTGNFGSGKSTVARLFKKKGARVINADRLAHEVFQKGNPVSSRIRSLFGGQKKILSRAKIAEVVFKDAKKRRALEAVIHPYVFRRIREELKRPGKKIVILEVPLLFESGFDRRCGRNIVVRTKAGTALKRLHRIGISRAEAKARWRAQWPLGEKIRRADYLIDNSDGLRTTKLQVEKVWKELQLLNKKVIPEKFSYLRGRT